MGVESGGFRYIGERSITAVFVKRVRSGRIVFGMAEIDLAIDDAFLFRGWIPGNVVDHKQVQIAIVVFVEPHCRRGPTRVGGKARFCGGVFERAVAAVAIERHPVQAGHYQIGESVVIVVACRSPEGVVATCQSCSRGDVFKTHAAQVTKEAIGLVRLCFSARGKIAAISEEQIELAVAIEIEHGKAAGHGRGQRLAGQGLAGFENHRQRPRGPSGGRGG